MKQILLILGTLLLVCGVALTTGGHKYAGIKKCKMCHKGEKNGMIFEKWQESSHAKSYAVLGEDAAKEVYTKLGKSGNPQDDPECLKCHVTGFGEDSTVTANLIITDGITCETCHGAGGDYWKKTVMENREQSIAAGMIEAPKEQCLKCHNEESPTYKEFNLEERWARISHSRPTIEE